MGGLAREGLVTVRDLEMCVSSTAGSGSQMRAEGYVALTRLKTDLFESVSDKLRKK